MPPSSVPDLHINTSEIVRRGNNEPIPRMPNREALIMSGPEAMDSGLILEQDRTYREIWTTDRHMLAAVSYFTE